MQTTEPQHNTKWGRGLHFNPSCITLELWIEKGPKEIYVEWDQGSIRSIGYSTNQNVRCKFTCYSVGIVGWVHFGSFDQTDARPEPCHPT
jgi:hypothetical protein